MADDGQVRIGVYVDNEGVKSSMDEAVRTVQEGTSKMSDAAEDAGKKINTSVSKGFDTDKLQQNFKKVEAQIRSFAKTITVAATGLAIWVKQSTNSIDRIDKLSQKLGMSRKAFQELDYAASQSGLSIEAFGSSMRFLVQATRNGGEAFDKLGINIRKSTGEIKSQEDLLFETLNKLADMPDSVERTTIGMQLLGRNFQQLTPLLNKGSQGISELRQNFHKLGLEVDDKTVDNFVEFGDALSDLSKVARQAFNNAIKGVIPQLKNFVKYITDALAPGGQLAGILENLASIIMNFVSTVLPPLLDALSWILDNANDVAIGITAIAVAFKMLTGNWVGALVSGLTGLVAIMATLRSDAKKTKEALESLSKAGIKSDRTGLQSGIYSSLEEAQAELDIAKKRVEAQKRLVEAYERGEDPIRGISMTLEEGSKKAIEAREALRDYEDAVKSIELAIAGMSKVEDKQSGVSVASKWAALDLVLEKLQKDTSDFASGWGGIYDLLDKIQIKFADMGRYFKNQFVDIMTSGILSILDGFEDFGEALSTGTNPLKAFAKNMIETIADMISAIGNLLFVRAFETYPAIDYSMMSYGASFKVLAGIIKGLASQIAGSYATGGIVGGNSYTGDRLLARVNSGEMILNREQQRRLFALANGGGAGTGTGNNIQIINNAGDRVTAEQSFDGRSIKIMVEKFTSNMLRGVKGGKLMGQTFGIRQLGRH